MIVCFIFFFKQKTAYEMRISDWSSDVCSSDLVPGHFVFGHIELPRYMISFRKEGNNPTPLKGAFRVVLTPFCIDHDDAVRGSHSIDGCIGSLENFDRSEERRVGKECVSKCRSRWSPYHYKKKKHKTTKQ